ncbi:hypothetical protein DICVIV_04041 [Dictyocaulus viviparus]|uniref:Uncharacterized protein n=1 Tax=Dictyocaulus viviparus TaxID=29172 RepID=A0A0D8XYS9_DICVI|nr:hypothetical protein DICVIV_04041 [Dictyocaulus viviparus]
MYKGAAHIGCEGPAQDQSTCPSRSCPVWSEWGEWNKSRDPFLSAYKLSILGPMDGLEWLLGDLWHSCIVDDLLNLPNLDELDEASSEMDSSKLNNKLR